MPKLIRISHEGQKFSSKLGNYQTRIATISLPSKVSRRIQKLNVKEGMIDTFHEMFRPNVKRTTKRYEWETTTFVDAGVTERFMQSVIDHLRGTG